jgi:hypothetical protein
MLLTSVAVRPTAAKNSRRFGITFRKSSRLTAWTVAGPANMNVSPYAIAKNAGSAEAVALAYASNNALTALLASDMPRPFGSAKEGRDDSTVRGTLAPHMTPSAKRVLALAIVAMVSGPAAGAQAPVSLVRVAFAGAPCGSSAGSSPCVVLIEGDGPLPEPSGGTLKNPDRIYLDFPGTRAKTSGLPRNDGSRVGIRVAVHSDAPLVTRVVVDLTAAASYTLDVSDRARGRVRLQLREAKRAGPAPPPDAHGPASPGIAPAKSVRRTARGYDESIKEIFDAIERIRPDLSLLDRKSMPTTDSLRSDGTQLAAAREALSSAKPPATLASAHAQLLSACGLAAMAFEAATRDPGGKVAPETASAAAGALILLDRAHAAFSSVR